MNAAIIGCGLIGRKRSRTLLSRSLRLAVCCDVVLDRAQALAAEFPGAEATPDWRAAATHAEVDLVIVASIHKDLAAIAGVAAAAGKHVLVEKPGACRARDLDAVAQASSRTGVKVRLGFNHRYHPSIQKAREIFDSGEIGPLMMIRARYGHGGRLGMEEEWRADRYASGGGEAIDQGLHLVDLARWFAGDFSEVTGMIGTLFWDMRVEDNAFFLLRTPAGQIASLHSSWTEWKNLFSFEIYGRSGKLDIQGLGGSYGTERLTFHKMLPRMGPPESQSWDFPEEDLSWGVELDAFLDDIRRDRSPNPGIADAQAALRIVETLYGQSA